MPERIAGVALVSSSMKDDLAKEMTHDLKAPMLSERSCAADVKPSGHIISRCHDGCLVQDCEQKPPGEGLTDMRPPSYKGTDPAPFRSGNLAGGAGCGAVSPNQEIATVFLNTFRELTGQWKGQRTAAASPFTPPDSSNA